MICPICFAELNRDGMCCNAGANSGYQCYCDCCDIWFVETFDGRIFIDEFLTLVAQPKVEEIQK